MLQAKRNLTILSSSYAVGPLMTPKRLRVAKALGFGSILNTLPKANSILADIQTYDIARLTYAANMEYRQLEIAGIHSMNEDLVRSFSDLLREMPKPVLAFSQTGLRATAIWAKAMACEMDAEEIRRIVSRSGFELAVLNGDEAGSNARAA